jgi:hypothetical protein
MRAQPRCVLIGEVGQTLADAEEIDDEIRQLFAALRA